MIDGGDLIKYCRLIRGVSQKKLAKDLHIRQSALSGWENGKHMPRYDIVVTCINYLGFDLKLEEKGADDE